MASFRRFSASASLAIAILGWCLTAEARPGEHTIRVEGAGALHIGDQFSRFDFGGGLGIGYEYRFIPHLGVEARYHAFFWPVAEPGPGSQGFGEYHALGLAARAHPIPDLDVGDLWIDAGLDLVLTGGEARPGIAIGVGFEVEIAWFLRAGPFVRYAHVFQLPGSALGPGDAGFLQIGISAAFLGEEPAQAEPPREEPARVEEPAPPPPPPPPSDSDGDGITDDRDACRDAPEDRDGFEDEDGCPDPDNDGDGIPDASDRCPNQPETQNQFEDEDGCPDEAPAEQELRQLGERVFFPHDRVRPTGQSLAVIRSVARLITAHPEWVRIEVEGHASDTGEAEYNMQLSQRRAERIREMLVALGVDASRLEVRAFGNTRPEEQGESETAHAANRRVTFTVVERRR